jgi:hypothetical protein
MAAQGLLARAWLKTGSLVGVAVGSSAVTASRHERDFYGWVEEQCAALRDHDSSRLD